MTKPTVFIHTNAQQYIGAKVGEYALRKYSRNNDKFEIKILQREDVPHLTNREGQTYLRKGTQVTWRNRDLQSFSPLRFLPPQSMGFSGRALVIDPDVFAVADVWELLSRDMQGKAIWCRLVTPNDGDASPLLPKKPWYATSVMLLDCEKLTHWDWDRKIDDMFAHRFDYGEWIFLKTEDPATIGLLEEQWNHFDKLTPQTRMLHTTERSTQPWKTGLPVDYNLNYKPAKTDAPAKARSPMSWLRGVRQWIRPQAAAGDVSERYLPHPDPRQEQLFFTLLKECLEQGHISEALIHDAIREQYVRPDALQLVAALPRSQAA